ncbi:deoxyxylulose-5-phosphate synthase [Streptomyces sp. NPDC097727]|uniref:deoxyxylulose-5-phosphate synthase n=1 Tax=Streptomyces sp. NPDC097727 TaxID=3366092 RepID=UPI0037FBAE69
MADAKTSYVCLPCGASYKEPGDREKQVCPCCVESLIHGGWAVSVPPLRDTAAWRTLSFLLNAGARIHTSCCEKLGYRPRTLREVRERRTFAWRTGEPFAMALVSRDAP